MESIKENVEEKKVECECSKLVYFFPIRVTVEM